MTDSELKEQILELSREYTRRVHRAQLPGWNADRTFRAGESPVPYAGRVFDENEVSAAVSATLDFWLTLGPHGKAMEAALADYLGVRHSVLVNSGSSANLLAVTALTSHLLPEDRRLHPGDEVITCAASFPTTVAPILQNGAVPVFVDNDPLTGNAELSGLEEAYTEGRTKGIILAHALGNPFDLSTVLSFCRRNNLWLIEDNCDSLGSTYTLADRTLLPGKEGTDSREPFTAPTGAFGDLSTQSFYPPHHLTMGEGGAVNIVRDTLLKRIAESFRDWGRDCWCPSGQDNTCRKRYQWQLGELPHGYDHKYIYSHLGYNLKPLDMQAAIGREQMHKLPDFVEARKRNWDTLRKGLADLWEYIEFSLPTHATQWTPDGFVWDDSGNRVECSWFGFLILIRPEAPFDRVGLSQFLNDRGVGTRLLFGGNITRQPALVQLKRNRPDAFRVVGSLPGADRIMNHALFLGTYPGLTDAMLEYMIEAIHEFVARQKR